MYVYQEASHRRISLRPGLDSPLKICDCRVCVQHAIELASVELLGTGPTPPVAHSMTFVALHGFPRRGSTLALRNALEQRVARSPRRIRVLCGCDYCSAHREVVTAQLVARRLPLPGDPEPSK